MSAKKIRIGIVVGSDFRGNHGGGIQPETKTFLKYAKERPFEIVLLGMSTAKDEPVGQVSKRLIYGREYPFIPLFYHDTVRYANRKPLIPVRVQTFLAYVLRRRLVDSLHLDILYLHAPQALPFFWSKRQPILYHMHNSQESDVVYSRYAIARTRAFGHIYDMVVQNILEKADQFIVIDQDSYDLYTKRIPGKKECFHLLPPSIDADEFRPIPGFNRRESRACFGLPAEGKIILCVGRLAWNKGVDLVVTAFSLVAKQVADTYLAIAGSGQERPRLEALVHELRLDGRVFFLGYVPHLPSPDLPRLYNCVDVMALGSYRESLGLVIIEALACGVPVVSTTVGIAPTVIRNGVTGYLVQSREPGEMADRILRIVRDGEFDGSACVDAAHQYPGSSEQICDVIQNMCVDNANLN